MKVRRFLNRRRARALLLLGALVLLATMIAPGPPPPPLPAATAVLTAVPVPLEASNPQRRRVGALLFRRGWDLDGSDPRFAGISAMHVENGQVTAISDNGVLLRFALPTDGRPARLDVQPLTQGAGLDKSDRDSEAMLLHGGHAWIAFERQNAIARFRRDAWRLEARAQPRAMRRWEGNSGAEGMVRLRDGRFLLFSEGEADETPFSNVVLFEGDPAERATHGISLRYRRLPGFRVTDAALLPDGRLLVLNRRFSPLEGISAKLVLITLGSLSSGSILEGREIAELRPPLTVDNMEALAVAREGGRTIVRIASDDNFMALQRTLLLEFELLETPLQSG